MDVHTFCEHLHHALFMQSDTSTGIVHVWCTVCADVDQKRIPITINEKERQRTGANEYLTPFDI